MNILSTTKVYPSGIWFPFLCSQKGEAYSHRFIHPSGTLSSK